MINILYSKQRMAGYLRCIVNLGRGRDIQDYIQPEELSDL